MGVLKLGDVPPVGWLDETKSIPTVLGSHTHVLQFGVQFVSAKKFPILGSTIA